MYSVSIKGDRIVLGRQGENLARRVPFSKPSLWREQFGEGKAELLHQRNSDEAPYPVVLTVENGVTYWNVSLTDTAIAGEGKCELRYKVGDTIVKSHTFRTTVLSALGKCTEEPPEAAKPWVDQVLDAAEEVKDAKKEAVEAAETATNASKNAVNSISEAGNKVLNEIGINKISTLNEITAEGEKQLEAVKAAGENLTGYTRNEIDKLIIYDVEVEDDITGDLTIEADCMYSTALYKHNVPNQYWACTSLIPTKTGDKFKITSKYGANMPLVAEFDSTQTMVSYSVTASSTTLASDYEYTVPENVSYIAINNRDARYTVIKVIQFVKDNVKRHIEILENSAEITNTMPIVATNQIADKSGWTVTGGTLAFDGSKAVITANKSNARVAVGATFGEYSQGDTVFFKANIKAPWGVGGSEAQNKVNCSMFVNSSTGIKLAVANGTALNDIEYNDYYGNITFDGVMNTSPFTFGVSYNNTARIPDNAQIEIGNIVVVNLSKVFGVGNEPTAEEFYSLLGGFENEYFEGEVNLFSASANFRRIYKEYKSSLLTEDITVTVGKGGDFETLNAAISYLSSFYPAYKKGGIKAYINILAGTVINEQIFANQIDLQYITIIAEAGADNTETITIDDTSHTFVIVPVNASGFGVTANAHDSRGNYPFIAGENAAKLPTIGCVFRLMPETVESGKAICGMLCNRGSEGVVLAASGFDGFNDGVIANNESSITIREGISRNMTRWGVHARHNGEVSARSCVCTNCGVGACADRIGDLDVREARLDGSTVAIECNNISRANANGCHANNCGAEGGYVVMVNGGGFANCGSLETTGCVGTLYNVEVNTLSANGIIFK